MWIIALGAHGPELSAFARGSTQLLADISYLDGENTLTQALENFPLERLVFGSGEAFLHLEAALLKLEHATLPDEVRQKICSQNLLAHLPS